MVSINGFLFGCALVVIFGLKALSSFILHDPCKGDGGPDRPDDFYYEECEDDETDHRS